MLPWPPRPRRRPIDRHLAATVKRRLETHEDVEITELSLRVKTGVVVLRGRASTWRQKRLAQGVAAYVPGVRGVFNEVQVEDSSTEGAK